jgi:hypothetical protein
MDFEVRGRGNSGKLAACEHLELSAISKLFKLDRRFLASYWTASLPQ